MAAGVAGAGFGAAGRAADGDAGLVSMILAVGGGGACGFGAVMVTAAGAAVDADSPTGPADPSRVGFSRNSAPESRRKTR